MLEHPLRTFIQPLMARVMRATHSKLVAANLIPHFDADPDCFFKDARSGSVHIMAASLIDDSFLAHIPLVLDFIVRLSYLRHKVLTQSFLLCILIDN